MIVRQVYVYSFYDRASHSYAGTCSLAEKLHWIALSYITDEKSVGLFSIWHRLLVNRH